MFLDLSVLTPVRGLLIYLSSNLVVVDASVVGCSTTEITSYFEARVHCRHASTWCIITTTAWAFGASKHVTGFLTCVGYVHFDLPEICGDRAQSARSSYWCGYFFNSEPIEFSIVPVEIPISPRTKSRYQFGLLLMIFPFFDQQHEGDSCCVTTIGDHPHSVKKNNNM